MHVCMAICVHISLRVARVCVRARACVTVYGHTRAHIQCLCVRTRVTRLCTTIARVFPRVHTSGMDGRVYVSSVCGCLRVYVCECGCKRAHRHDVWRASLCSRVCTSSADTCMCISVSGLCAYYMGICVHISIARVCARAHT